MVYSNNIATNFMKERIHLLFEVIVLIMEKNQGLWIFTASDCLQKYFLFHSFHCLPQFFQVTDADSLVSLALETCATSSPNKDAFFIFGYQNSNY